MHQPTLRVMEILNLLCRNNGPLRLSQISRELNMPKSTLLPILQTLVSGQYLTRDESEQYRPGYALLALGAGAGKIHTANGFIRDNLRVLSGAFDETCYYGVLEEGWVRYLEKVDSTQSIRMLTDIGQRLPAYATAVGKALLLDKTEQQLRLLYPESLEPLTENTVKDIGELFSQLEKAKTLGYTWEVEESTEHIRCFASPVWKNGRIVGAVSIAIPVFRFRKEQKTEILKVLKKTVEKIQDGLQLL